MSPFSKIQSWMVGNWSGKEQNFFQTERAKAPAEAQQSSALQDGLARCSPLAARSMLPARHRPQRMILSKSQGSGRISLLIKCLAFSARDSPKDASCNYTGSPVQLTSFNRNHKFKKKNFKYYHGHELSRDQIRNYPAGELVWWPLGTKVNLSSNPATGTDFWRLWIKPKNSTSA